MFLSRGVLNTRCMSTTIAWPSGSCSPALYTLSAPPPLISFSIFCHLHSSAPRPQILPLPSASCDSLPLSPANLQSSPRRRIVQPSCLPFSQYTLAELPCPALQTPRRQQQRHQPFHCRPDTPQAPRAAPESLCT